MMRVRLRIIIFCVDIALYNHYNGIKINSLPKRREL